MKTKHSSSRYEAFILVAVTILGISMIGLLLKAVSMSTAVA